MVIWLIGLSGSGKTFFSKEIEKKLAKKHKIFILDGDEFRKYISYDLKYSVKDRELNSKRIQNFSKYLEEKGYLVIVSILSIFTKHQKENRNIFDKYYQIYIKADFSEIKRKNNKKIYHRKKNVVGKDIKFFEPYKSDFILNNHFDKKKV